MFIALAFVYGLVIGSFLNVVILRLPRGEKLGGRSRCAACGKTLSFWELVPLISFLALLGKCRGCGERISPRYFLIESASGILFALAAIKFDFANLAHMTAFLRACVAIALLITVFVIDLEHYLILDKIVFWGIGIIFMLNVLLTGLSGQAWLSPNSFALGGLIGALMFFLPFFLVWYLSSGTWMGFGDVKLALLLGLLAGWPLFAVCLLVSVFAGGLTSAFLLVFTEKKMRSMVPFGTFLSFGALITLFYGTEILAWYLGILGF